MRPLVKICGLTNLADARLAHELGADCLGFVFAPSVRQVTPRAAAAMLDELRTRGMREGTKTVAVFVNESPERMAAILRETGIDIAQIHGDETPSDCAAFDFPWYRALRIVAGDREGGTEPPGESAPENALFARYACGRILFDAAVPGIYGGSGTTMDAVRARVAVKAARAAGREVFVAGGIRAENVAKIVLALDPDGIDVSSGVEERPGRKSPEKLAALFRELAGIGRESPALGEEGQHVR
jgi:phosphoribosylanthranilate isomerase